MHRYGKMILNYMRLKNIDKLTYQELRIDHPALQKRVASNSQMESQISLDLIKKGKVFVGKNNTLGRAHALMLYWASENNGVLDIVYMREHEIGKYEKLKKHCKPIATAVALGITVPRISKIRKTRRRLIEDDICGNTASEREGLDQSQLSDAPADNTAHENSTGSGIQSDDTVLDSTD